MNRRLNPVRCHLSTSLPSRQFRFNKLSHLQSQIACLLRILASQHCAFHAGRIGDTHDHRTGTRPAILGRLRSLVAADICELLSFGWKILNARPIEYADTKELKVTARITLLPLTPTRRTNIVLLASTNPELSLRIRR